MKGIDWLLLTALPAEAQPLRQALKLTREQRFTPLPLYRNGPLALALTGPGGDSARAAIEALLNALPPQPGRRWLNYGIAGHPEQPLGTWLEIDRLTTPTDDPPLIPAPLLEHLPRAPLISLLQPDYAYTYPGCCDLEGYPLARSLLEQRPAEPFHCLKCISDNRAQGSGQIRRHQVRTWSYSLLPLLIPLLPPLSPLPLLTPPLPPLSR